MNRSDRNTSWMPIAASLLLTVALTQASVAQCQPEWLPGQGIPGTNGAVHAVVTWDPDGPGPQPEFLVVGGAFTTAGNETVNRVAAWDGEIWRPLGAGMGREGDPPVVNALTVYNGELIAGGFFTTADGVECNNVARWDGQVWQPLGTGVGGDVSFPRVFALTVYNGELIVAGQFTTAGGVECSYIARWNGSVWRPLGTGIVSDDLPCAVRALTVFDGELVAGGAFTAAGGVECKHVARWNGTGWQPLDSGVDDPGIDSLTVYGGELIAGGGFHAAGGVVCRNIAGWDGNAWRALGSGVSHFPAPRVYALTVHNGELIAAGRFSSAGGVSCDSIAGWDGTSWRALSSWNTNNIDVYAVGVYGDELVAGGSFTVSQGAPNSYIARKKGQTWHAFGARLNGALHALAAYDGNLFAGGVFTKAGDTGDLLSRWTGTTWEQVGLGIIGGDMDPAVRALTVFDGELVVAGTFLGADGGLCEDCFNIARWDGSDWLPLDRGIWGEPAYVFALTAYNGDLIAGGKFTSASGVPCNRVARWEGDSWHPLGEGIGDREVYTLTVYNGDLIAGGNFTSAGGGSCNRIARWDGSSWQPLGTGLEGDSSCRVRALCVYQGELIVGGVFTTAGGNPANNVAAWNGGAWRPLGTGLERDEYPGVYALDVFQDELIAGGFFATADGQPADNIARWDGGSWQPMGAGLVGGTVNALTVHGVNLTAGGTFLMAGGQASAYWARWGCTNKGDLNCDAAVDGADIEPFFLAVGFPDDYVAQYPNCELLNADMNGDNSVDGADIDPFFDCLGFGNCP